MTTLSKVKISIDWDKIGKDQMALARKKLIAVGFEMARDIKVQMSGAGSGIAYGKHTASAPGNYPAVRTGRLRASISCNWTGSGLERGEVDGGASAEDGVGCTSKDGNEFKVTVGTNVNYAPYLEFGTSKMGARPFLRPTVEKYRNEISRIISELNNTSFIVSGI